MTMPEANSRLRKRIDAFRHAGRGLATMLRTEAHAKVHAQATLVVVVAGGWVGLDRMEWVAIVLTIAAVWSLEAVNTAIEAICDRVSPEHHELIAIAKDVAAGAVLVAAMAAVLVAVLIFGPHLVG